MQPTILVVDDEADIRGLLRVFLQRAGYTVAEAATGLEVQAAVVACNPDLVLLDVMLPGRDGYDVCRLLKDDPASRHIPVLMQTALRGRTEELRALAAGADGFLSKPIDRTELLAQVKAHVPADSLDHDRAARQDVSGAPSSRDGVSTLGAASLGTTSVAARDDREAATLRHDLYAMLQSIHGSAGHLVQQLGSTLDRDEARILLQIRADAHRARQLLARLGDR